MNSTNHPNPLISGVQFVAILMLVIAIFQMPPNYYSFLRCVVLVACVVTIYDSMQWTVSSPLKWLARTGFVLMALLFNPVFLCTFYKTTWGFIDLAAMAALFWAFSAARGETDNG